MPTTRRRLGQHSLVSEPVIEDIRSILHVRAHDAILEVGPGAGALTPGLMSARSVTLVELDRGFAPMLQRRFPTARILQEDIRRTVPEEFRGRRIVGNLPYYLSSELLLRMADIAVDEGIPDLHFMVQKEVAARIAARPGSRNWGRLSVALQRIFDIDVLLHVEPEAFNPPPQVESAFVRLVPKPHPARTAHLGCWDEVLRRAFGQRRKMLGNSLKSLAIDWDEVRIDPALRAEDVDLDGYLRIAEVVERNSNSKGG